MSETNAAAVKSKAPRARKSKAPSGIEMIESAGARRQREAMDVNGAETVVQLGAVASEGAALAAGIMVPTVERAEPIESAPATASLEDIVKAPDVSEEERAVARGDIEAQQAAAAASSAQPALSKEAEAAAAAAAAAVKAQRDAESAEAEKTMRADAETVAQRARSIHVLGRSLDADMGREFLAFMGQHTASGLVPWERALATLKARVAEFIGDKVDVYRCMQMHCAAEHFGRGEYVALPLTSQKALATCFQDAPELNAQTQEPTGRRAYVLAELSDTDAGRAFTWARGSDRAELQSIFPDATYARDGVLSGDFVSALVQTMRKATAAALKKLPEGTAEIPTVVSSSADVKALVSTQKDIVRTKEVKAKKAQEEREAFKAFKEETDGARKIVPSSDAVEPVPYATALVNDACGSAGPKMMQEFGARVPVDALVHLFAGFTSAGRFDDLAKLGEKLAREVKIAHYIQDNGGPSACPRVKAIDALRKAQAERKAS
jgi:hypothetical protein